MDPIFIQVGPLAVRWYGLLIALGVLVGAFWALKLCEKRGLDPEKLLDMALWLVIAGVVGARLLYVLTSPSAFFGPNGNLIDAFKVWQGGISIHGGVIGVMIAMWLYCRKHKLDMWAYLDVLTPLGALGIMGGRIGNVMNGTDTGGRLTDWAIGITWPEPGTPFLGAFGRFVFGDNLWQYSPPACFSVPAGEPCVVHFTQGYGFLVGLILLFIVVAALARKAASGYVFWLFVVWYSILRSVIEEPFRDNPLAWQVYLDQAGGVGLFTFVQLGSIPIILVALYMMLTPGDKSSAGKPNTVRASR
ncbi:MAG TPA: prolipoprotein diacylglyceryl transferase [Trueperaceae bacterium]|nr:prolipoprotein diacylglyceryl transferase [Trueperaceae bacterium]